MASPLPVVNWPKIHFSLCNLPFFNTVEIFGKREKENKLFVTSYSKYKSLAVVFDIIGAVRGEAAIIRSTVRILQVVHCQYIWRVNPTAMYAVFCIWATCKGILKLRANFLIEKRPIDKTNASISTVQTSFTWTTSIPWTHCDSCILVRILINSIDMQTKASYSIFFRSNYMRQSCKPVERLGHPNKTFRLPSPDRPIFFKK